MASVIRQGRMFKDWLKEINWFDHVSILSIDKQRLATRIYVFLLTSKSHK